MQPQDSIFHSGFLGEVQFKFDLKKWTFEQKSDIHKDQKKYQEAKLKYEGAHDIASKV